MDVSPEMLAFLHSRGVAATTLASWFEMPVEDVYKALDAPVPAKRETDLSVAMRDLGLRIVDETHLMLDEASPAIKQRLLTNMFSRMATLLMKDDTSGHDELRKQMQSLFKELRGVEDEDL